MNGGIPWRKAARADRYRVSSSCAYSKVIPSSSSSLSFFKFENNNYNNNDDLNDEDKERKDDDDDDEQIETTDKNLRHRMRNLDLMTINSTLINSQN